MLIVLIIIMIIFDAVLYYLLHHSITTDTGTGQTNNCIHTCTIGYVHVHRVLLYRTVNWALIIRLLRKLSTDQVHVLCWGRGGCGEGCGGGEGGGEGGGVGVGVQACYQPFSHGLSVAESGEGKEKVQE